MTKDEKPLLLTRKAAAALLGVEDHTFGRMRHEFGPITLPTGRVMYSRATIEAKLAAWAKRGAK